MARSRKKWSGAVCLIVLALIVGLGAAAGLAMWQEARRGAGKPLELGVHNLMVVYLVRDGGAWTAESVGVLGSNLNHADDDPDRCAVVFRASGVEYGYPRMWREEWTLKEPLWSAEFRELRPIERMNAERRALARRALNAAILDGSVPWHTGLATADTVEVWHAHRQLLNGIESDPYLIGAGLLPALVVFAHTAWKRSRPPEGACRGCRYPLAGLPPGSVCPECGR